MFLFVVDTAVNKVDKICTHGFLFYLTRYKTNAEMLDMKSDSKESCEEN